MHRHCRFWITLGTCCLVSPFVFYAFLPSIAARVFQYALSQQGYQQVAIRLGYPGWHTLSIPYVRAQRELGSALLSVTVERAQVQYDLLSLLRGRMHQLTLPSVAVALHGRGSDSAQPCQPSDTALAEPGLFARLTAGHVLQRLPALPWDTLVLEYGRVFRECETGPLREIRLSGTLYQRETAFAGSVTFQGQESAVYRLEVTSTPEQTWQASLHTEGATAPPIMALQSHVQRRADQVEMAGTGSLDVTRFVPFLTLIVPRAGTMLALEGSLQARWQGSAPASTPLATVWQHPATVIAGDASLTLKLPKASVLGDNCSLSMQGEVRGNAVESTYRLGGMLKECALSPLAAQAVDWGVQGTLAMDAQHIWGRLGGASSVKVSAAHFGEVVLPAGALRLREPVSFRANRASGAWAAGPARVDFQGPRLSWQEKSALVTEASLSLDAMHGDAAGWQMVGALTVSGRYEDVEIQGVDVRLKLQTVGDTLSLPEPVSIRIATVKAGLQVTDLALAVQPAWEPHAVLAWVELRNLQAALLGGHIRSPGVRYTPGQLPQTLTVSVEQLDVQQLLQLEQQQRLEGTGTLDGVLPVLLTPTGFQIQDGRLTARPPGGILRYRSDAETGVTPAVAEDQLAFVMQALANFHYQALTLGVHYIEDGTLRLSAEVEGQNPDWQHGRPVHLNLTIQENIPALLQSLQLIQGEGVEQSIHKHIQRYEEKATDTPKKAIR